jgi:hypothetical protein
MSADTWPIVGREYRDSRDYGWVVTGIDRMSGTVTYCMAEDGPMLAVDIDTWRGLGMVLLDESKPPLIFILVALLALGCDVDLDLEHLDDRVACTFEACPSGMVCLGETGECALRCNLNDICAEGQHCHVNAGDSTGVCVTE